MIRTVQILFSKVLLGFLVIGIFILPSSSFAQTPSYIDLYIKVHVNTKEGRLHTFNPESPAGSDSKTVTYTPEQNATLEVNTRKNRDFAQSVFLQITNLPMPVGIDNGTNTSPVLLVNAVSETGASEPGYQENPETSTDDFYLLSPLDGFLHFKIQDNPSLYNNPIHISLKAPDATNTFPIHSDGRWSPISRGSVPYGYYAPTSPEGATGIYEYSLDLKNIIENQDNLNKIVTDLVLIRNDDQTLPLVIPDYSNTVWVPSETVMFAQQFSLRAYHALDWVLKVDNYGVDHSALTKYYNKIINVVNGFLIIMTLVIAFMWNFSMLIPRSKLRQIMIVFIIVSVLVNFSTPLIKLMVDGANVLQNSFLTTRDENGTRRMQAKDFFNYEKFGYSEFTGYELEESNYGDALTRDIYIGGELSPLITEFTTTMDGTIGPLNTTEDGTTSSNSTSTDVNGDPSGSSSSTGTIDSTGTIEGPVTLDGTIAPTDTINLEDTRLRIKTPVSKRVEDKWFNSTMLILSGIGYYLVAFLFLFRTVVLWFLIILSPIYVLLLILPATQQYFRYWSKIFVRWIVIGPLFAILIGATIFIWKEIGIPLTSLYSSAIEYTRSVNFQIGPPGSVSLGLTYTKPMMEYIIGLLMMYIPYLLAFWLTRKLPCCPSEEGRGLLGMSRKKKQPAAVGMPPPTIPPPKEPPAPEVLPTVRLAPTTPGAPAEGMFFTLQEKEERIKEANRETTTAEKGLGKTFEAKEQETTMAGDTITSKTREKETDARGLESVTTASESREDTSSITEASPFMTEYSTKELAQRLEETTVTKQAKEKLSSEASSSLATERITITNELRQRASHGDMQAQMVLQQQEGRIARGPVSNDEAMSTKKTRIQSEQVTDAQRGAAALARGEEEVHELQGEEVRALRAGTKTEEGAGQTERGEIVYREKATGKAAEKMLEEEMEDDEVDMGKNIQSGQRITSQKKSLHRAGSESLTEGMEMDDISKQSEMGREKRLDQKLTSKEEKRKEDRVEREISTEQTEKKQLSPGETEEEREKRLDQIISIEEEKRKGGRADRQVSTQHIEEKQIVPDATEAGQEKRLAQVLEDEEKKRQLYRLKKNQ